MQKRLILNMQLRALRAVKSGLKRNRIGRRLMASTLLLHRDLTETMDEETILFVMGDHGMTRSGDHGGDSRDEVMAGLFVYSKKGLFQPTKVNSFPTVLTLE